MSNSVTKIVFPLSGGSHLQNFDYFVEDVISIPYVSVPLNTLHKAVKTLQKQKTEVTVTDSIYIYSTKHSIFINISMKFGDPKNPDIFTPELYDIITYEWLLKQITVIEKGVKYTECCLLHNTELLVFNTENTYNNVIPITLIEILIKALKTLIESKEEVTKLSTSSIWNYFIDFIVIKESGKAVLSDKAKRLIADMKLKGMQGTTTYGVLQSISNTIKSFDRRKES